MKIQFSGSSNRNGGRIGSDLSLSLSDNNQLLQSGPSQALATAAASSGFAPQIIPSKNWLQKNGFHCLMRPSWHLSTILSSSFFFCFPSFFFTPLFALPSLPIKINYPLPKEKKREGSSKLNFVTLLLLFFSPFSTSRWESRKKRKLKPPPMGKKKKGKEKKESKCSKNLTKWVKKKLEFFWPSIECALAIPNSLDICFLLPA